MDLTNGMLVIMCFCTSLLYKTSECSIQLTITPRPPAQLVEQSMKAARLKYGGDIPIVDITGDSESEQIENTCRRISVRKYIGDRGRNCTSLKPYPITKCDGVCFPQNILSKNLLLQAYAKLLERSRESYKCVADRVVKKRVKIFCEDDQSITEYRIRVIKTCKCKQVKKMSAKNSVPSTNNDGESDSVSQQAKMFGQRLHNLRNKLKVQ